MAIATIDVVRKTGASGSITVTSITSTTTRMSTSDLPSPGSQYPIPIPGAGTNYSYWVSTRLRITANPDGHTINNLRWFPATSNAPAGIGYVAADASTGADAGYRQATGTLGTTGTQLTQANHSGLDAAPVDVFTFTASVPKTLAGSATAVGEVGDHLVYQGSVASTAAPGVVPTETWRWRYDEV